MTDYFLLLDAPRRPALDAEELHRRFLQMSAESHPDRFHSTSEPEKQAAHDRYAALNTAFQCLHHPKERLLHLLELELGGKPKDIQRIPPGTMDLFVEVGQLCRDIDAFLVQRSQATSPLLKVRMFEKSMDFTDQLNQLKLKAQAKASALDQELAQMNPLWESAPAAGPERLAHLPLERLEQIYRVYSYINRWNDQIQERIVQLAVDTPA